MIEMTELEMQDIWNVIETARFFMEDVIDWQRGNDVCMFCENIPDHEENCPTVKLREAFRKI